jgi:hypothetical protein
VWAPTCSRSTRSSSYGGGGGGGGGSNSSRRKTVSSSLSLLFSVALISFCSFFVTQPQAAEEFGLWLVEVESAALQRQASTGRARFTLEFSSGGSGGNQNNSCLMSDNAGSAGLAP